MSPDELFLVGRVGPARGVHGDVFVEPRTDAPEERFTAGAVLLTEPADRGPLRVEASSLAGGKLVVRFAGVEDRPAAQALRGISLWIRAADRPPLADPEEFYDSDLVGLHARTRDRTVLGTVREVLHSGGTPHLVVDIDGHDHLVPFVVAIVPVVDLAAGSVLIDAPEGVVRPVTLRLDVVTIFPDYLAPLRESLLGKAIERGRVEVAVHDLRRWTDDVHRTVDDAPYGGGPGMVMRAEPWGRALDEIVPDPGAVPRVIVPTPAGRPFRQADAARLAVEPWLLFACGRYEGIDARVTEYAARRMPVEEVSLGDYVLSGGEVAVLVMVEAIARLLPGVLGNERSAVDDSFGAGTGGLLESPVYTRPASWRDLTVPPVLLSGDHGAVERWRLEQSRQRTQQRRPDLI